MSFILQAVEELNFEGGRNIEPLDSICNEVNEEDGTRFPDRWYTDVKDKSIASCNGSPRFRFKGKDVFDNYLVYGLGIHLYQHPDLIKSGEVSEAVINVFFPELIVTCSGNNVYGHCPATLKLIVELYMTEKDDWKKEKKRWRSNLK